MMALVQKQRPLHSNGDAPADKLVDMSSHREEMIQRRQREAAESKARTLQMYDNMAKSGNAGDRRPLDINTYRGRESGQLLLSGAALQKTDLVEETIRERVRASEENKKRLLAAYDYAAKTQPAGTVRDVDFESFKGVDGECLSQRVSSELRVIISWSTNLNRTHSHIHYDQFHRLSRRNQPARPLSDPQMVSQA